MQKISTRADCTHVHTVRVRAYVSRSIQNASVWAQIYTTHRLSPLHTFVHAFHTNVCRMEKRTDVCKQCAYYTYTPFIEMYPQGTAGTQTHIIHFHAHTNTRTSHTQSRALTHTQTHNCPSSAGSAFPCFPSSHPPPPHVYLATPTLWLCRGQVPRLLPPTPETGEKNVPGAPYLLFFVPLLVPSFAFWAGGANGEMAN